MSVVKSVAELHVLAVSGVTGQTRFSTSDYSAFRWRLLTFEGCFLFTSDIGFSQDGGVYFLLGWNQQQMIRLDQISATESSSE